MRRWRTCSGPCVTPPEQSLDLSPDKAKDKLESLHTSISSLHPFVQAVTPSFPRINAACGEVQVARENLLQALSVR
jgi:hypothetical protein